MYIYNFLHRAVQGKNITHVYIHIESVWNLNVIWMSSRTWCYSQGVWTGSVFENMQGQEYWVQDKERPVIEKSRSAKGKASKLSIDAHGHMTLGEQRPKVLGEQRSKVMGEQKSKVWVSRDQRCR